jgi:hypothetical protein
LPPGKQPSRLLDEFKPSSSEISGADCSSGGKMSRKPNKKAPQLAGLFV